MAQDLSALQAAIKLVADAVNASIKASGDATSAQKIAEYQTMIPDLLALLPKIGDIPAEVDALAPSDYASLLQSLATDLVLPNSKASGVLNASVKLLSDISQVILPDVQALVAALKA